MINPDDILVDTDVFPSTEETDMLMRMASNHGYHCIGAVGNITNRNASVTLIVNKDDKSTLMKLAKKGHVGTFAFSEEVYFFLKDHPKCRSMTVEFRAYFPKLERMPNDAPQYINKDEKDKVAYSRHFIARWVYQKEIISDIEYSKFLMLFTHKASYTMSFPKFLIEQFQKDIDKTGMTYNILTPEYTTATCPFCREKFQAKSTELSAPCPKCKRGVLIR